MIMINNLIKAGTESAVTLPMPLPKQHLIGGIVMIKSIIPKNRPQQQAKKNNKMNKVLYEHIYNLYVKKGLTINQCAKKLGYKAEASVYRILRHYNITTTGQPGKKEFKCAFCGKSVYRYGKGYNNRSKRIFCSKDCSYESKRLCFGIASTRQIEKKCKVCGKIFYTYQGRIDKGWAIFCSRKCYSIGKRDRIKISCYTCGKKIEKIPFLLKSNKNNYCDRVCFVKDLKSLNGDAGYDKWNESLVYALETRRALDNKKKLEVKCSYCGRWHKPSGGDVSRQVAAAEKFNQDLNFYCSIECKDECPIYNQHSWPKSFKKASSREVDPHLRQMCLERDEWECQKCGATESLHSHHIEGAAQNKMISNDIDNVITLCKACHKEVHQQEGCHYYELRCKEVETEVNNGEDNEK